jgi:hypothetical protein
MSAVVYIHLKSTAEALCGFLSGSLHLCRGTGKPFSGIFGTSLADSDG